MKRPLAVAVFLAGLLAVGWVGLGYVGTNPLALVMTALIGAVYLAGALELRRFQQATSALSGALAALPDPLPSLGDWLAQLPAPLRTPVRLRVEGERSGLPGPAMTPYLVGLLVLLGMLGTFLGMVFTLKGAVIALESTTDLQAIRAALAAPVKGLGVAFGTSVAGVAASAMLGLLSALCRRERLLAAQLLDTRIASGLHAFSRAHQRQQSAQALQQQATALQQQAQALPALVDRLQAMALQIDRQHQALGAQLLAGQQDFHRQTEARFAGLAASVDESLRHSLSESARLAGATIQPVVEATMAGITRETAALHGQLASAAQQQLDGLAARLDNTAGTVADTWTRALAAHEHSSSTLAQGLQHTLDQFSTTFAERSAALLASVQAGQAAAQAEQASTLSGLATQTRQLHEQLAAQVVVQLDGVAQRVGASAAELSARWQATLAEQALQGDRQSAALQAAWQALADTFSQRSASLLATVDEAQAGAQARAAAQDAQRLAAMDSTLQAITGTLQQAWAQAGETTLQQQQQICRTLELTAQQVSDRAEAHARATITEMAGLMQAAAEAPRAAAEVIGLLRDKLSDSLARDNTLLEERSRIMAALGTVLDAVNQASAEQRSAVDALVATSSQLLAQAGSQFTDRIEAESGKLADAAAQITGSAVEVASLGEAFGFAVQLFSTSNQQLVGQLQRIEAALGQSQQRSDDQLAYYVAQAREIIDLSLASQQQIVEDLQRLASRQATLAGEAA